MIRIEKVDEKHKDSLRFRMRIEFNEIPLSDFSNECCKFFFQARGNEKKYSVLISLSQ